LFGVCCILSVVTFGKTEALIVYLGQKNQSKQSKLCETNPISEKPKMNLTHYITMDYERKSSLLTMQKRTQTNPKQTQFMVSKRSASNHQSQSKPILPPYMAGKIALSLSKGSNPFYPVLSKNLLTNLTSTQYYSYRRTIFIGQYYGSLRQRLQSVRA